MSVPSPYSQRGAAANTEPREDCRDYLRTGRCKYGASCKYNHPPNVQSGGGMKVPVDPSEPMFPVRPNEPVCQYYMKHGTCKFGQACKFNHPPQSSVTAALVGGGTVVMNVGRKSDGPQIVVNSISGDGTANGTPMMLQFLPQRPEEQDCIFFLKNGRCKYGSTCRYHHPINFNQRSDTVRRQPVQVQHVPEGFLQHSKVQFINQAGNHKISYQQDHPSPPNGCHMVVADGPVTYMSVDGLVGKGGYHAVSVVNNDLYCAPTGAPISHNQDHTSSTSSIASSYDTASSMDHFIPLAEQSSGLWNRQKNNGSHASLNSYDSTNVRQQIGSRMAMPQSTGDGSIASRQRHRAASYGSASDNVVFMDATGKLSRATSSGALPSSHSASSISAWRNERTTSFDNVGIGVSTRYRSRGDLPNGCNREEAHATVSIAAPSAGLGPRMQTTGRRRSSQAVDDGLSMMTSALLTMLDTQEEVPGERYEFDREETGQDCAGGQLPHPHNTVFPPDRTDGLIYAIDQRPDVTVFSGLALNSPVLENQYRDLRSLTSERSSTWLPSWRGSKTIARPFEGDAQAISAMQLPHPGTSSHDSSDVGLFLP